jgi:nicotinate phosphoribosyltransferase
VRGGRMVERAVSLEDARDRLRKALVSLPWEGLKLSRGEPAIATRLLAG